MTSPTDDQAPPAHAASQPKPGFVRRHWGKFTLLAIIGVPSIGLMLWVMIAMGFTCETSIVLSTPLEGKLMLPPA